MSTPAPERPVLRAVPAPEPDARDIFYVRLTRDGRLVNRHALDELAARASTATDCFVFAHLAPSLGALPERVKPLRLALQWPSFAEVDPRLGERFGRELLAPLWANLHPAPRLHLIGRSIGATVVTSAVLGGARPDSLSLLLGTFSAHAFAAPGCYHRILAERMVKGRVVVLHSDRTRGALGLGAPRVGLREAQRIGLPRYALVNVDGSRGMTHHFVSQLLLLAAGLLEGGPDGLRPPRRTPFDGCRTS